jgi:hypothetical protein
MCVGRRVSHQIVYGIDVLRWRFDVFSHCAYAMSINFLASTSNISANETNSSTIN